MFKSVPPGLWVIGLRMRLSNAKWEVPMPVMEAADRAGRSPPSPAVVTIRSRAKYSQVRFETSDYYYVRKIFRGANLSISLNQNEDMAIECSLISHQT